MQPATAARRSLSLDMARCAMVLFCLRAVSHHDVRAHVDAGSAYRIGHQGVFEVHADGQPLETMPHGMPRD
jgi:hypothetical protein